MISGFFFEPNAAWHFFALCACGGAARISSRAPPLSRGNSFFFFGFAGMAVRPDIIISIDTACGGFVLFPKRTLRLLSPLSLFAFHKTPFDPFLRSSTKYLFSLPSPHRSVSQTLASFMNDCMGGLPWLYLRQRYSITRTSTRHVHVRCPHVPWGSSHQGRSVITVDESHHRHACGRSN